MSPPRSSLAALFQLVSPIFLSRWEQAGLAPESMGRPGWDRTESETLGEHRRVAAAEPATRAQTLSSHPAPASPSGPKTLLWVYDRSAQTTPIPHPRSSSLVSAVSSQGTAFLEPSWPSLSQAWDPSWPPLGVHEEKKNGMCHCKQDRNTEAHPGGLASALHL